MNPNLKLPLQGTKMAYREQQRLLAITMPVSDRKVIAINCKEANPCAFRLSQHIQRQTRQSCKWKRREQVFGSKMEQKQMQNF